MLCFSMLPIPLAFAADITVSNVSVTPSSLSGGGNVTVKGTIKNTVGEDISLSVSYAEDVADEIIKARIERAGYEVISK